MICLKERAAFDARQPREHTQPASHHDGDPPAGGGAAAPAAPDLVDAGGVSEPCGEAHGFGDADGCQWDDGQHDGHVGAGGYADGGPSSEAGEYADGCLGWSSWRSTGAGCLWFWPLRAAGDHSRQGKGVSVQSVTDITAATRAEGVAAQVTAEGRSGQSVSDITAAARPQRAAGDHCRDGKRQGRQRDSDDGLVRLAAGAGISTVDADLVGPGGENLGVDFFECESKDLAAAYQVLGIPDDDSSSSGANCG